MSQNDPYQDWKNTLSERRQWERYPPIEGAVAMVDGRSYRLMDISLGGFSVYDYGDDTVPEETVVALHCVEGGFFLDAVRCRKVSDQRVVSPSRYGEVVLNRIGLQIVENDPEILDKLGPFLGAP